VERLERVIDLQKNFASAYELLMKHHKEVGNKEKQAECKAKLKFYKWVPPFAKHIEFTPENEAIVTRLCGKEALECVETTLASDSSKRSSEFMAAICWHHYHGPPETKSFELLEERAHEDEYIHQLLFHLLENHQSVCTIKGVASALAGIRHPRAFDILKTLLPQDVRASPLMFFTSSPSIHHSSLLSIIDLQLTNI